MIHIDKLVIHLDNQSQLTNRTLSRISQRNNFFNKKWLVHNSDERERKRKEVSKGEMEEYIEDEDPG